MFEKIFNKIPRKAVPILREAYLHQSKGWTDNDYKDCYFELTEKLGKEISANAFEKMVHAIGAVTFVTEPAIKIIHSELESVNKTEKLRLNLDVLHRKMVGEHLAG